MIVEDNQVWSAEEDAILKDAAREFQGNYLLISKCLPLKKLDYSSFYNRLQVLYEYRLLEVDLNLLPLAKCSLTNFISFNR